MNRLGMLLCFAALWLAQPLCARPADGAAGSLPPFSPAWIDEDAFDERLRHVHGSVPDPEVGLFGPDSMMWKITRYIEPGGLATGRAILMHVSHPWIAQGIEDHSKSRHNLL